jgi:DNA polymerase III delta prime subunit
VGYFADRRLATAVFLALKLQRPLLLEGEPGVGKTALAQALSKVLERSLIRLQCYDGLEQREALYEWNYAAQLLHMRAAEMLNAPHWCRRCPPRGRSPTWAARRRLGSAHGHCEVYQDRYLIRRPLLQALQAPAPGAVLLIDEVDRADEPFEAFLLEYLGEYQVSIPEIGTVRATATPVTILTSNRTRDLHDAVKRRCLYHWLDYPERERELAIVRAQVPGASEALATAGGGFCRPAAQPAVCQRLSARAGHCRKRGVGQGAGGARHHRGRPRSGDGYGGHFVQAARGCGGAHRRHGNAIAQTLGGRGLRRAAVQQPTRDRAALRGPVRRSLRQHCPGWAG